MNRLSQQMLKKGGRIYPSEGLGVAVASVGYGRTDMPADLRLQEAYKLRQAQQQAAMNAIDDPVLQARFANQFSLGSLDDFMNKRMKQGNSGEVLLNGVYDDLTRVDANIRFPDKAGGCFPKGVGVRTKDGFKHIETIQVGDWVLSSPEDGTGEQEYKRVVKTFVHHDKTIRDVFFYTDTPGKHDGISATDNHPFWVEGIGWTRADELRENDRVRIHDGSFLRVCSSFPIYSIAEASQHWRGWELSPEKTAEIGWRQESELRDHLEGDEGDHVDVVMGYLWDYANNRPIGLSDESAEYSTEDMVPENRLRTTVYNIEVEDFHTYYVADFWVHNTNCAEHPPVVAFSLQTVNTSGRSVLIQNQATELASIADKEFKPSSRSINRQLKDGTLNREGYVVSESPNSGRRALTDDERKALEAKAGLM